MPYLEEGVGTVESGPGEIKDCLGVMRRSFANLEKTQGLILDDLAELKAGQIEILDLLAGVVSRLEGVAP